MLELRGISHRYNDQWVLRHRDLTLNPGQRLAIMGPSGCGKTTLLRLALGLTRPTEGTVENTFRSVGTVFQEPRLLPWRTALENVNLVLGDTRETLEQAEACLARVDLAGARDKLPRELSGGMQQRVALARALAVKADCLVLDEPFKAMDGELRRSIIGLVNETKAAILLVTHDEEEAALLDCEILRLT
ncbi:MAG: ABC transporter ATP-binding protein [Oscillospiraceae bacterium]|nr:ABC transporter ATP-binding protein [Oscillospiraceae bacterium]